MKMESGKGIKDYSVSISDIITGCVKDSASTFFEIKSVFIVLLEGYLNRRKRRCAIERTVNNI